MPQYKLQQVIDYIDSYLDRDSFVQELSSLVQMSPHYFSQLFKGTMNITPHQYVIRCRIERAKNLLRFLDSYTDLNFSWWQKLVRLPQIANQFRDRLIFEDISILENLYSDFEKKITLKNDTPAELAMNYLQTWN